MKKFSLVFVLLSGFFVLLFSCKKINEATELGGDLIPAVDNVTTFETSLTAFTKNSILTSFIKNDTAHRVFYGDQVALGDIVDPEFGHVHANFCFSVSAPVYKSYPFLPRKDTIHAIDSVILSIRYSGVYGDTLLNGTQTVNVYEIPYTGPTSSLNEDSLYRYSDPASDFNGTLAGSKTYTITRLRDSFDVVNPGNTFRAANVVRIKLNNSIGAKLADMDTSSTGGYYNDSLFKTQFNGLAIKANNGGNALTYFKLNDTATKLIVYYKYKTVNNKDTAGIVEYSHPSNGQSNYVNVQAGSNWAAALSNPSASAEKIYIQSSPSGSYASIAIPDLSTFGNKVIHRAEIIATRVPSASDNMFTPPNRLFLDIIRHRTDSSLLLEKDLIIGSDGSIGYELFGGTIKDNLYRFNITRYVQGIVTRHERNDTLRLWAPLRTFEYSAIGGGYFPNPIPVNPRVAEGRVVLGGGTYPDQNTRLRLRIVYSNL